MNFLERNNKENSVTRWKIKKKSHILIVLVSY